MPLKNFIKRFTPKWAINLYHGLWSYLSAVFYGFPSCKLVVVGVTGTNGKSTTANLIAKALEARGDKVAVTSTVNFKIAGQERLNNLKMTMPGHAFLQKFLKDAVGAGCKYAVIETSSEGLVQNRHWGLYYDVAVFTNLTPEHIESHGSFENYRKAKKILFNSLGRRWRKKINGQEIPTIVVANADDEHAHFYLDAKSDLKATFGLKDSVFPHTHLKAQDVKVGFDGVKYRIGQDPVELKLKGKFDVYNSLAALAAAQMLDIPFQEAQRKLLEVAGVPGRLEVIQKEPFMVVVDYAPEPESLRKLYETIKDWNIAGKVIHVLGSTGGGRDVSRRPVLGEIAAKNAGIVIVTNEDPYDDDPQEIIHQVADGAVKAGKVIKENLFRNPDRRGAMAQALSYALPGDLVLVTGKGSEQKMAVRGGYIDWDDRQVLREELSKLK